MWVIEVKDTGSDLVIDRIELRGETQTTIINELTEQFENLIDGCTLSIRFEHDSD